jgi:hypothetical protein
MAMKRQIYMCVFMSMVCMYIKIKFEIEINNGELLIIIWKNYKGKKWVDKEGILFNLEP